MNIESKNFPDFFKTSIEVTIIFKKDTKQNYLHILLNIFTNIYLLT